MKRLSIAFLLIALLAAACGTADKQQGAQGGANGTSEDSGGSTGTSPSRVIGPEETNLILGWNSLSIQEIAGKLSDLSRTHDVDSIALSLELDSKFEINCNTICEVKKR